MPGEPKLARYGIQTEQSDYRAHVCFAEGAVYLYETAQGVAACKTGNYPVREAYQSGVEGRTALGYLVPPAHIPGCRRVPIPADLEHNVACRRDESTSAKGRKAVQVVAEMMRMGLISLPMTLTEVNEKRLQLLGIDALTKVEKKLQVKCDFYGGMKPGGSGNLYLQFAERNPRGMY